MITEEQQKTVENHLNKKIKSISPLSSTKIARVYRITAEDKSIYVLKTSSGSMDIEAWSLNYLAEHSRLPVPKVFYHDNHMAIMEFISSGYGADETCQKEAAELLSELHQIKSDKYGFEHDTFMGPFIQKKALRDNWLDFFVEDRLMFVAEKIYAEDKIDRKFMRKLDKFTSKLDKYIPEPNKPSLIHGNVWGGNLLSTRSKMTAFLGPALCFADYEMELSFILLLKTFGEVFFKRYHELSPIKPGFFEERSNIYSLYYLLMYSQRYGRSYILKAQRILDKLV